MSFTPLDGLLMGTRARAIDHGVVLYLLRSEQMTPDQVEHLLGHWGTTPGLNLLYVHLNRVIAAQGLNVLFITGPGHGGCSLIAHAYLEGTYSEAYPNITEDEAGMKELFTQFSFSGGIPSHVAQETPGSIHEGGELGYALSHAFGAGFDSPDLIVAAIVGDGEAEQVHQQLAAVTDTVTAEIHQIWSSARTQRMTGRPVWPMIIRRTHKGWTCPAEIDGKKCEACWRSHQVPMGDMDKTGHVAILEQWMKSCRSEELFDAAGKLRPEIARIAPKGSRRMSANPHADGGLLLEDLRMPDYRRYAARVPGPGAVDAESTREISKFLRDVMRLNLPSKNFRLLSPDEDNLNRWQDLLSSHVWRQDHNGFSHQDPGFLDHVANKKAEVIRIYLPPDANTLLSVTDHCLRSRNYVNVVVAGKQPAPQWLTMDEAEKHCDAGLGVWEWASSAQRAEPDVVMACCGDVPTLETLAAVDLLRQHLPDVKVRVVNVVNLMKLQPPKEHPHGLTDNEFDAIFSSDRQIIFAFHGYPSLIHQLTYRRTNHGNLHVRGFQEEGTTNTPFDMVVMNDMDRFHLVMDVIDRVPGLSDRASDVRRAMVDKRAEHKRYMAVHGEDLPEIIEWRWRVDATIIKSGSPS